MANFQKGGQNVNGQVIPATTSFEIGLWGPVDTRNGKELTVQTDPPNAAVKITKGGLIQGNLVRVYQVTHLPRGKTRLVAKDLGGAVWTSVTLDTSAGRPAHGGTVVSPPRPEPAKGTNYPVPGYHVVKRATPTMVAKCQEILHGREPKGTWIVVSVDGREYLFAVEWHKHAPTDNVPANLKDWHRGVTVYEK
ncbi:MAG: hypothetical protein JW940_03405 [Polyangiaceae bacterium]|nr:hypothetical protein [Polyangiaceae bacterium]